jgi:sensor histidine kinase regulating citrate/malate metabolism
MSARATVPVACPPQGNKLFAGIDHTRVAEKHRGGGLPIARKVVEDHGGTITLRSELNVGTTFTIRLPMHGPTPEK